MATKVFPKAGDQVTIKHQVKRTNSGEVLGLQRNDKPHKETVSAVFSPTSVRVGICDVWEVAPTTMGNWETVNPLREAR